VNRTDIINELIEARELKSYLEIGVRNKADNFDKIKCGRKLGVDVKLEAVGIKTMSSAEFWEQNGKRSWGLIFLDGGHDYETAKADLLAAARVVQKKGVIVMHDCLPKNEAEGAPFRRPGGSPWCGQVWRVWAECVDGVIVDCDHGVGIVQDICPVSAELAVPPWKDRNLYEIIKPEDWHA